MNNKKKHNILNNRIIELKKIYFYTQKMTGGKRSREIEKEGYSFFKPQIDNIKNDYEYDINTEISNLLVKKNILKNFDTVKKYKEHYQKFNFKSVIDSLNYEKEKENENDIDKYDENFHLIDKKNENCDECLKLFSDDIKTIYNSVNKNSKILNKKINNYYNLLLKAYSFDYMTEPTLENKNKLERLNHCYKKLINSECKNTSEDFTILNIFTIDIKNNLEIINTVFN